MSSDAVGVVAGQGEVSGRGRCGRPDRDDLAVGLERHAVARSSTPPKSVVCLAVAGEARVERAVGVVAGQGEVERRRSPPAKPTTTILPSAWSATRRPVVGAAEVGGQLAVAGEAGVERAVGVVAGEREVARVGPPLRARPRRSCRRPGAPPPLAPSTMPPKSVVCLPSPEKRRVEDAVGVVAGEGEVAARCRRRGRPRRSCRRPGSPPRSRRLAAAEVGPLLAVPGEGGVERAVGVVAGEREVAAGQPRVAPATPTATILPSAWIATAVGADGAPPKSVVSLPSPAKLVSSEPFGL